MSIILPNGASPEDPVVQQAMQQEVEQAKLMQLVNGIKTQMLVSVYAALAVEHKQAGHKLDFDEGRALVALAREIQSEYDPFLFESIGLARLEKKE